MNVANETHTKMLHTRVPPYVADFLKKNGYNITKVMSMLITNYVDQELAKKNLERDLQQVQKIVA